MNSLKTAAMIIAGGAICSFSVLADIQVETISMDKAYNMGVTAFRPEAGFRYTFVNGASDISDGSDYSAVQSAFNTWIDEPSSALWAAENNYSGGSWGVYNGRNEISWISPTVSDANPWNNILNLSQQVIAAVITVYNPLTKAILERDLFFNDVNMNWRTNTDGQQSSGFFVEHIALHEIGHIFGLKDMYNPGSPYWESWMGDDNEDLTMYGYSSRRDEDTTLSETDKYAMSLLHPAAVPEPSSISLLTAAIGFVIITRKPKR